MCPLPIIGIEDVMNFCLYCSKQIEKGNYCKECAERLAKQCDEDTRRWPTAVRGLSDGPGSMCNEAVFMRPDPLKETRMALRRAENAGKFVDNPKALRAAVDKLKALEKQEPFRQKVDYEKDGHPLEGLKT